MSEVVQEVASANRRPEAADGARIRDAIHALRLAYDHVRLLEMARVLGKRVEAPPPQLDDPRFSQQVEHGNPPAPEGYGQ